MTTRVNTHAPTCSAYARTARTAFACQRCGSRLAHQLSVQSVPSLTCHVCVYVYSLSLLVHTLGWSFLTGIRQAVRFVDRAALDQRAQQGGCEHHLHSRSFPQRRCNCQPNPWRTRTDSKQYLVLLLEACGGTATKPSVVAQIFETCISIAEGFAEVPSAAHVLSTLSLSSSLALVSAVPVRVFLVLVVYRSFVLTQNLHIHLIML